MTRAGSVLTLSVLLSHPHEATGGAFMTYDRLTGRLQEHRIGRGDAILFHSEKMHNVAPLTWGLRHSFVMELWQAPPNRKDRFS